MSPMIVGPFTNLQEAAREAYISVDDDATMWSVIEVFGVGFSRANWDGEEYGTLFVCETDEVANVFDSLNADSYQIIETYGYEKN